MMQLIIIIVLVLIILIGIILIVDSNRFHVVNYELKSKNIDCDVSFVFVSDLHGKSFGKQNEKLIRAIDSCNPQAVLIGGDLLTARPGKSFETALSFLDSIRDQYPIYYANGNHEHRLELYPEKYGDMAIRYEEALKKRKIHRIVNETVSACFSNVDIIGCQIERKFYHRTKKVVMTKEYLDFILPKKNDNRYTILMAHNPIYFDTYSEYGADLVLSGHVHGGIARLPFLGGVISPELKLFPHYDGGLFKKGNSVMILSRGLGAHTIPLRFLNPGELVCITIRKEDN